MECLEPMEVELELVELEVSYGPVFYADYYFRWTYNMLGQLLCTQR